MKEIVFEQQSNSAISADNIRISVIEMHQIECLVPVIMTEEGSASTCGRERARRWLFLGVELHPVKVTCIPALGYVILKCGHLSIQEDRLTFEDHYQYRPGPNCSLFLMS